MSARWIRWKRAFELYVESKGITNEKRKRALLLHSAGMEVQDIYYAMEDTIPTPSTGEEYTVVVNLLTKYFTPEANTPYERHIFRSMSQRTD